MKPITYTYDWGMVTDLARRNIARMCGSLGIENIVVSANLKEKTMRIFDQFIIEPFENVYNLADVFIFFEISKFFSLVKIELTAFVLS